MNLSKILPQKNTQTDSFIKKINIPKKFWITTFLGYLISFSFKSFGLVLILPLVKGLIERDYSFVFNNTFFQKVLEIFPTVANFSNEKIFIIFAGTIIFLMALSMGINYFISMYVWREKQNFIMKANELVLNYYLMPGNTLFTKKKTSDIRAKLMQIGDNVSNFVTSTGNLINYSFDILSISIILIFISKQFFFYSFIFLIIYFFIFSFVKKNIRKKALEAQESNIAYNSIIQDTLHKYSLIQIFNTQKKEQDKFIKTFNSMLTNKGRVEKVNRILEPFTTLFEIITLFIMGFIIGYSVLSNPMTGLTTGIVFIALFQKSLASVNKFSSAYFTRDLMTDLISTNLKQIEFNDYFETEQKKKFEGITKLIDVRKLNFKYENYTVFKDFSAKIIAGKINCITGLNGTGKSTLLHLIMRLKNPPSNSIFIDDIDILDFDLQTLRDKISYVAQDIKFFYGTVRENIAYRNEYNDEIILDTLNKLGLRKFIEELPEGLDTIVGEDGLKFSGGQRQRFAIAQAILNNSDIIIFDEATKSIDNETEDMIMNMLVNDFKDKTRIIVTHNPQHIVYAENIINL